MIKIVSLFIILFSLSVEAKWESFSSYDKMDHIKIDGLKTYDLNGHKTIIGKPKLLVRSSNGALSVFIDASEYVGNVEEVEAKFDNDEKITVNVSPSTDNRALFISDEETFKFIKNIVSHKVLLVRYLPYNESPVTLEFDLKGFIKSNKELSLKIQKDINKENLKIYSDNIMKSKGITDGNKCDEVGGLWAWNATINQWECLSK